MKLEKYIKGLTQSEKIELLSKYSKSLKLAKKRMDNASKKEFEANINESKVKIKALYAKTCKACDSYNCILEDLKLLVKLM